MRRRQKTGLLLGACVLSVGIGAVNASAYTVAVPKNGEEAAELCCPECGAVMDIQAAAGTELAVEADEDSYYYTWEGDAESTVEAVAEDSAETVRDTEREKEYAEIGITVSQNGTWLYEGEEISFLLDEDQGVYNNDTDGGRGTLRICLPNCRRKSGKGSGSGRRRADRTYGGMDSKE